MSVISCYYSTAELRRPLCGWPLPFADLEHIRPKGSATCIEARRSRSALVVERGVQPEPSAIAGLTKSLQGTY